MSNATKRIVDSYGDMLSTGDVVSLFSGLKEQVGSRTRAAELCDVTPSTTYSWEKGVKYIKTPNKKQVLHACLNVDYEFALELVLNRAHKRTSELAIRMMRHYFGILLRSSRDDFFILYNNFNKIKHNYHGVLNQEYFEEITNMRNEIVGLSSEFGEDIGPRSLEDFTTYALFTNIMRLCMELKNDTVADPEELSRKYDIPMNIISQMINLV